MKFLIVGDLHGSKPNIYYKDFDAIIAAGDFCSSDVRMYCFQAMRYNVKNPGSKHNWYDITGRDKAKELLERSLADGRAVLEQLNSYGVPVYIIPGNWDWVNRRKRTWDHLNRNYYPTLFQGLKNVIDVQHKIKDVDGYQIIGYGICHGPEYPQTKEDIEKLKPEQFKKRKKKYKTLSEKIDTLFQKTTKPVIFLSHNVPYNTPLDLITNEESPKCGHHMGSVITREMIERYHPLICIGGHMHEHFDKCRIGKTVCLNTGFGPNVNTFLVLEDGKIKELELHNEE